MVANKATKEKIAAFNERIHGKDGSIALKDLRNLNSVYKREYVKMVLEEDNAIREHVVNTSRRLTVTTDTIVGLEQAI